MDPTTKKYIVIGVSILAIVVLVTLFALYSKKEGYRMKYLSAPSAMPDMTSLAAKSNNYLNDGYTGITASGDHVNRFSLKNSESRPRFNASSRVEAYAAPAYDLVY